jgi:peptide chain release factor subunit 1
MIVTALDRWRRLSDPSGALLTVFLTVPADPSSLRELPARLDGVLAAAATPRGDEDTRRRGRAALAAVRQVGTIRARDWFGHHMAVVASADGGVVDEIQLPCPVPDRAVFGYRPYLRLLVRAIQHCRNHAVVVVDRRQAWLFQVSGQTDRLVRQLDDQGVRDRSHAGWHGLDEYRVRNHAGELARRHYDATADSLAEFGEDWWPFVVAGHSDGVAEFLASLSQQLRDKAAGSFAIDPHTMTSDNVRAQAATVMAGWETERQRRLAEGLAELRAADLALDGVEPCAELVNSSRADLLVVRGDEMAPGWVCGRCGAITTKVARCHSCGAPARPVPDVIDEMVARMLDAGEQVDLGAGEGPAPSVTVALHGSGRRLAGRLAR